MISTLVVSHSVSPSFAADLSTSTILSTSADCCSGVLFFAAGSSLSSELTGAGLIGYGVNIA